MARIEMRIPDWLDKICTWPVTMYRKWKYGYTYRRIYLGEGEWALVEPADYYRLSNYRWFARGNGSKLYALRSYKVGPKKTKLISMHKEIMSGREGFIIDHRNSDSLDNRRANLRYATQSQNIINSRRDKSKATSRYRGVHYDKARKCWMAMVNLGGKKRFIGRFEDEVEAAKAYDEAALIYHKEFARLNFPESATPS